MLNAINYALNIFYNSNDDYNSIIYNAMDKDFSWDNSCLRYIELYNELVK